MSADNRMTEFDLRMKHLSLNFDRSINLNVISKQNMYIRLIE